MRYSVEVVRGAQKQLERIPAEIKQPIFDKCRDELAGHLAVMVTEASWVSQSSLISPRPAARSLNVEASLGSSVATQLRRLISLLSRVSLLLVRSLFRWAAGKAKTVKGPRGGSPQAAFGS